MRKAWKVLHTDGRPYYGGYGAWDLPSNGEPGAWRSVSGRLHPCKLGLHLCRRDDLIAWLGPAIFEAEYAGDVLEVTNKIVVRRARLVRRLDTWTEWTARLFACDCAQDVLPLYEHEHPGDDRPRHAIKCARQFARGETGLAELDAARAAAGEAARDAVRAAAWAAARAAARAAACTAAWEAVRDAVKDAAWAAAWAAARAATCTATCTAAWDAACAAACAAAREAAGEAYTTQLFALLYPDGNIPDA